MRWFTSEPFSNLELHLRSEEGNVAREAIRALIDSIVVQPGDERGGRRRDIQLHDDLFEMLNFAVAVAGLPPTPLPAI